MTGDMTGAMKKPPSEGGSSNPGTRRGLRPSLDRLLLGKAPGAFLCLLGLFRGHLLEGLCHLLLGAAGIELYFLAFYHLFCSLLRLGSGVYLLTGRFKAGRLETNPSSGFTARTPSRRSLARGTDALTEMFGRKRLCAHQARPHFLFVLAVGLRFLIIVTAACHR